MLDCCGDITDLGCIDPCYPIPTGLDSDGGEVTFIANYGWGKHEVKEDFEEDDEILIPVFLNENSEGTVQVWEGGELLGCFRFNSFWVKK